MAEDDEDSMTEVDVCRTHLSLLIRTLLLSKLGEGKYVLASFLIADLTLAEIVTNVSKEQLRRCRTIAHAVDHIRTVGVAAIADQFFVDDPGKQRAKQRLGHSRR